MRESGILMPVSSLPGPYGIGCFGAEALKFVDFLAAAGQHIWQLLPLSPTGYGDSPYQSCSAFAGNPYFIDLDLLAADGLLTKKDYAAINWGGDAAHVDYGTLYEKRFAVLRKAYANFLKKAPRARLRDALPRRLVPLPVFEQRLAARLLPVYGHQGGAGRRAVVCLAVRAA